MNDKCPYCGRDDCLKVVTETDCPLCRGTGIGQHGDPDTSRCTYPGCRWGVITISPVYVWGCCDEPVVDEVW